MKYFYYIFSSLRLIMCIICLLPCLSRAQEKDTLKVITPADYSKWYQLYNNPGLSGNGNWIGYTLYTEETDTLIIRQTHGIKKYKFARAGGTEFLGDSIAVFKKDSCYLLYLNSGRKESFLPGTIFQMSNDGLNLIIFHKPSERLKVNSMRNKDPIIFEGITAYYYHGVLEGICTISSVNGIGKMDIIMLEQGIREKSISIPKNREVLELNWHSTGNYLAFTLGCDTLSQNLTDVGLVGYYDLKKEKILYLNPSEKAGFPRGNLLVSHWNYPLTFSTAGKQVFFAHKPKIAKEETENPEIWKSEDPYVRKRISEWSDNFPKISMWNTAHNDYLNVTDQRFPEAYYGLVSNYALVYNPAQFRSYNEALNDTFDIYMMDLFNGKRKLMISKYAANAGSLYVSPSGRYVLYLVCNHWWCYDTQKDVLSDLTKNLKSVSVVKWENEDSVFLPEGWTRDEKAVYMYDPYDMWKIAIDDTPSVRITNGRERGIRFRLITNLHGYYSSNTIKGSFLNDSRLFFEVSKGDSMGYAFRKSNGTMTFIFFNECYVRWPEISSDDKVLAYQCENFNVPPRMMVYPVNGDSLLRIFQSNTHYRYYQWHDRKKITYYNKTGKKLTGILYYPPGYKKDSVYPMVVHVYEKQSKFWNQYVIPSFYNSTGYNPTNLAADGYFVFLPDIEYEIGNPGYSAADCIISGTLAAIENAPVDPSKIGIIGQSFGGYETLFTITRTDLFATAIAGAGITDYSSDYLNMEGDLIRFFQYETNQLRMGKSLFEDYKGYLENSPLYHARNVHIPLLLFTGGKDYHVNFTQTKAFHLAMKRLRKPNTMIIYPEEAHAFSDIGNMKDLTIRTHQWFAHYLKGGVKMDWMP